MRVSLATLGCKVNQYDSASIETRLRSAGCEIVPFSTGAEVVIVNSCTVTDRADAESRQLARRARRLNPNARIVLTGCFAQVGAERAAIPEVDHVIGLDRLDDVVRAVHGELDAEAQRLMVADLRNARRVQTFGATVFSGQTRAFLKVQEGCDLFCSFCIVPFARGRSRSVPPSAVLAHLAALGAGGFREVVLTGVHLGGYGWDLAPRTGLCDLLEMILERPPVARLRLSSVDPPEVSPRLLDLMAGGDVLCPHLHVPLQAGDDGVLKRMRRRYDSELLRDVCGEIRLRLPDAAIGTDLIAGFPGETETEFAATETLLEALPLTYFHVFPYSKRAGTRAAQLPDPVPRRMIKRRAAQLRALGERKRAEFARRFVGRVLDVLSEEESAAGNGCHVGYSRNYQRVEFAAAGVPANRELRVRISDTRRGRLSGTVVGSHE